jgi:CubicO group peptidase (beta-lactamase class C family)
LPRLPSNLKPADSENPYAEYSVQKLYDFLSGLKLTRNIEPQYEYSNLGGGLLGHILSLRAGMDYESLVRKRICEPLRLNSTVITLTKEMKPRLATGHNADLQPVPLWDLPALAGAGALRSTANDLLIFLAANLGYLESPLAPAMAKMLTERRSTGNPNCMAAIGWHILARSGGEIAWHNGGTGGFRSFIGYDRPRGLGVVVLSNSRTAAGVDDVALQLLEWR